MTTLAQNYQYIKDNKERLIKEHRNKYLLVYDENLIDSFDTFEKAASEGMRLFGFDGVFLVQQLTEEEPLNFVMAAAL